jgi:HD-GYP domain-containing protein (c-di-GMP phosphodiesterase class II)
VNGANQADVRLPLGRGMAQPRPKTDDPKTGDSVDDGAKTMGVRAFENQARAGNLGNMGDEQGQPAVRAGSVGDARDAGGAGASGGGAPGRGSPLRWAPWLVVGIAAAVGAVAGSSTVFVAACVVVLAAAATGFGWRSGEHRRRALEQELESHSGELTRAFSELELAQAETVRRLSMAVEFRDEDTGAHIERIGRFSTLLAEHVGMDTDFCATLTHAAPLHDVGKVAIPDAILLKPDVLTKEERAIVETHAEEGHRLLRGSSSSILELASTIALSHHEKWDGSGYPRGVKGEAIPIEGRIVAVADVFDALTSDRVYRRAFTVEEAVEMMLEQRGRHFDPVLLDAFMEVLGRSGPDARGQIRAADPGVLVEGILETFATALQRGDAETAEGAIAQAIEDGVPAAMVHDEVIEPALRRLGALKGRGELDASAERQAMGIARRVLATLRRFMLSGEESAEVLARIDRSVATVEAQLGTPEHAVG